MIPLRDENPTHTTPFVVLGLILVNIAVFAYEASLGPDAEAFLYRFGMLPIELREGNISLSPGISPYLSIVTSLFLHGGLMHLIGNMWFLWIFGDNIEDFMGHFRFLLFYLVCGAVAALAHALVNPDSALPTVGASGAISAVLGAYIFIHPRIRVKTLVTLGFFWNVVHIPAIYFLGLWFLMQFLGGFGPATGVAYGAHIGGFLAGLFLVWLLTKKDSHPHERYEARRETRW